MGRGTVVTAGSSSMETAWHPGAAWALPPTVAQRSVNPGHQLLAATPPYCSGQDGTEPGAYLAHALLVSSPC